MNGRLHTRFYDSHSIVAILSQNHAWADCDEIHLSNLEGHPMVLREVDSNTRRSFEAAVVSVGITPDIMMEIESGEAFREAVAKGHGIGGYGE